MILALEKMLSWLVKAEDTIRGEKIQVETIEGLEKQLKLFRELESDLKKEEGNYRYFDVDGKSFFRSRFKLESNDQHKGNERSAEVGSRECPFEGHDPKITNIDPDSSAI